MPEWIWSYLLVGVGLVGFVVVGQKVWWGWFINFFCQFLWLAYAVISQQYGFIIGALVYMVVFGRNAYKWTEDYYAERKIAREAAKQRLVPEPIGHISNVEFVDEGLLVHGHLVKVPDGQVIYQNADGELSVGPVVPRGAMRLTSFYHGD